MSQRANETAPKATEGETTAPPWAQELRRRVEEILLPLVRADGGSCTIRELSEARVVLRFSGRCAGCPGWEFTTQQVAEPLLRPVLPAATELLYERRVELPPKPKRHE